MKRLAALTCLLLVISACTTSTSSSTASGGSGSTSGGSGSTQGVTNSSITVGGLIYKTTSFGASVAGTEIGAKALFQRINDTGGINGRKIDFVGAQDDNGDPSKDLAAAQRLVEQDKVFAVVPVNTFAFTAGSYLAQHNVPFFGYGYLTDFCKTSNQYGFGFNGCVFPTAGAPESQQFFYSLAKVVGVHGQATAYIGTNSPEDIPFRKQFADAANAVGFKFVGLAPSIPQPNTPTDWSPYVNAIMHLNHGSQPEILYSNAPNASVSGGLFSALRAAGYRGILIDGVSYRANVLQNAQTRSAYQGAYIGVAVQPTQYNSPAVQQMKQDIAKVAGNVPVDLDMEVGYATADVFVQILKLAGRNLTTARFLAVARHDSVNSGISGPVSFPLGFSVGQLCAAIVRVEGSQFVLSQPLTCAPPIHG